MLKEELTASPIRKIGALMSKGGLKRIAERMNPESYGGAPILGLKGWVFKIHGSARRTSLMHAMRQAGRCVELRLNDTLIADLSAATAATASTASSGPPPPSRTSTAVQ